VISWHRMDRLCLLVATWALPLLGTRQADDLCAVLKGKQSPAQLIAVRAVLHPTMHGAYLAQHGCESSLLLVLAEEIPGYSGLVKTVKDDAFKRFLEARYDYRPDAPQFEATFRGVIEAAPSGSRFGYYRNHRLRFVLRSVNLEAESKKEMVVISDPPMTGKRPNVFRRVWNCLTKRS
jgi:hypothetical protein